MVTRGLVLSLMVATAAVGVPSGPAGAQTVRVYEAGDLGPPLGSYQAPGGKRIKLRLAVGSGLARGPGDPGGQLWALGDRGPSIGCDEARKVLKVDGNGLCDEPEEGRIFPRPDYAPSILRLELDERAGTYSLAQAIPLRRADGRPASGLPGVVPGAVNEVPLDGEGHRLAPDPGGVDPESLVRLADGTFWVGEEYGPSLLHVAADGRILDRLVPAGTEGNFAKAGYPVRGTLPAILARRAPNRGFEGLAAGEDGRFLYAILQNALANPDKEASRQSTWLRIVKVEAATGRPAGEYVYPLEPITSFRGEEHKARGVARVSELVHLGAERFLVVDRTDKTTHLVAIDLAKATDILGGKWDAASTSPTLEEAPALAAAGIVPAAKALLLDSAAAGDPDGFPRKVEGAAVDGDGSLLLASDDDFGVDGERGVIVRLTGLALSR